MLKRTLLFVPFVFAAALAGAQTTVVVTANNPLTGDAVPSTGADVFVPLVNNAGFGYNNIRTGTTGIDGTYARSGNGSAHFSNNNGKGDIEFYNVGLAAPLMPLGRLADVSTFGYDYYRSSTSTAGSTFSPVIRLFVDLDGSFATTADQGLVIYEPIYQAQANGQSYTAPVNTWTTDVSTQSVGRYYTRFRNAQGVFENQFQPQNGQTLSYLTNPATTGLIGATNNGTAVVYGFNAGVGSGWGGTFDGAVDNIQLGFAGGSVTTYNFEVTNQPVPEPATMAALGLGVAALIKRRKSAQK